MKILLLCLVVFMGVYLIVDLFEKFSRFLEAQVPPELILRYYLFSLPKIFTEVLPVAVLLASVLSLGGLARHNELLAMKMGQIGTLRIALPCIALGLLASGAAWIITEYVAPRTNERALNIERTEVRRLPAHQTTRDSDIWYRAQGNRFVHISLIETESGLIRGMSVFQLSPTSELVQRTDAREATWGPDGWTLRNGWTLDFTETSFRVTPFQTMRISLSERPEEFARVARSPQEMSYVQLRRYIERLVQSGVSATRYRVDLYAKVAISLVSLVMTLIGVSFGLRTGKGGAMVWVGACIPMGFLYWMLLSVSISLGRGGVLPPLVAAWLPNTVFGLGGLLSLWRLRG